MNDTLSFLSLAEIHADYTKRSLSTISRLSTGSGMTIARLHNGRSITNRRVHRALQWFSDNWPSDLDWRLRIPPLPELRDDLHSVQRVSGPTGIPRLVANRDSGSHADRFWSLALAVTAATQKQRSKIEIITGPPKHGIVSRNDPYYDLYDDLGVANQGGIW